MIKLTAFIWSDMEKQQNQVSNLIAAGILLGMGAAGFFDGIVLHQILQWHHMLTSVQPSDIKTNTLWDGLFHLLDYAFTVAGVVFLWRAGSNSKFPLSLKTFGGSLLLGAGLFNVIEGLIDHQILGIHHVKSGPNQLTWDIGFLLLGAVIAAIGWIVLKSERQDAIT